MSGEKGVNSEEQPSFPNPFIWRIGVRQVILSASGIALFALFTILFNVLQIPNAAGGALALLPESVIPLVFGVLFGPIIGFLVGGGGNVISDVISYHAFFWNWELGSALIGFIAGLVVLLTDGRFCT